MTAWKVPALLALACAGFALVPISGAALAPVAPPGPGPYPAALAPGIALPLPNYGSLVHLKAGVCNQKVSVIVHDRVNGRGTIFISDNGGPGGDQAYHWLANTPASIPPEPFRIFAGNWIKLDWGTDLDGKSVTLDYASSDCPVAGSSPTAYKPDATIVNVKIEP